MVELKKELIISLIIQIVSMIKKNGNLLKPLAEWMFTKRKMVKSPLLRTTIF